MKPRLTHVGVAATLLVAATGLVGCGSADPSAAAIVDGTVIKDADVWAVIEDLTKLPRNRDITVNEVLPALIMAQVVQDHRGELKAPTISPDAAKQQLQSAVPPGQPTPTWHQATVKTFQDVTALSAVMDSPSQPKVVELVQKAQVTVNPKYGEFDRKQLTLTSATPNWMVPAPTPTGMAPQAPQPEPGTNPTTLPGAAPATSSPATTGAASPAPASPAPAAPAPATSR